jgi:hypothetical protein
MIASSILNNSFRNNTFLVATFADRKEIFIPVDKQVKSFCLLPSRGEPSPRFLLNGGDGGRLFPTWC